MYACAARPRKSSISHPSCLREVRITVAIELISTQAMARSVGKRGSRYIHNSVYRDGRPPSEKSYSARCCHSRPRTAKGSPDPTSMLTADWSHHSLARTLHPPLPPSNPNPHTPPLPSLAHALSLFPTPPTLFSSRRAELTPAAAELTPVTRPRRHRSGCIRRHDRVRAALRFVRGATR